jgi:NADPH-dependent 2,4-dienoyl-CoA reductase/sulfur reductase-like enzyme
LEAIMSVTGPESTGVFPLTRRGVLVKSGLTGGSALVMSAMRSWNLMAQDAGPRPVLSGRPSGTKVIVLGAGVSGLATCYELNKLGYNVRILEARDRVGVKALHERVMATRAAPSSKTATA